MQGLENPPTWGGADSATQSGKRKRGEGDEGRKRRKRKAGAREVQEEASSGDETTDDDDGSQGGQENDGNITMEEARKPAAKTAKGKRKGKGKGKKSKSKAAPKAVPERTAPEEWAIPAREDLEIENASEAWKVAVATWFEWEQVDGFLKSLESHSTEKRPVQVGEWVSRARSPRYDPGISNSGRFGVLWEEWWWAINPAWRVDGKKMRKGLDGDWTELDVPGKNGFFSVLICLKWWYLAAKRKPGAEWRGWVEDVTWVLEKMTAWKLERNAAKPQKTPRGRLQRVAMARACQWAGRRMGCRLGRVHRAR
ncbi:hypothetical protein C8F01DRAFT_687702 [Mycena amicta]|nr:hypothetical protein C8F01DRAFT_687702 [Mycena amicta]